MARNISDIRASITTNYVALMATVGVTIDPTQWSRRNLQRQVINTFANAAAVCEQRLDQYQSDIETMIAQASPQTAPWFQAQMFKFQFDATDPQIIKFDTTTFAPFYNTVDEDKQIIKYCSVTPGPFGTTLIKIAAQVSGFPSDIESAYPGSLDAATSYARLLSVPGITINVQSGNSDKLYIAATIYYQGLYSAVISDSVIEAIKAYLFGIQFNGVVILSDLERAIKAVSGVNDVVLTNVQARADGTAYGSGTNLVVGVDGSSPIGNVISRKWDTVAGYIQPETTSTHELTDSLTFIAE